MNKKTATALTRKTVAARCVSPLSALFSLIAWWRLAVWQKRSANSDEIPAAAFAALSVEALRIQSNLWGIDNPPLRCLPPAHNRTLQNFHQVRLHTRCEVLANLDRQY